MTIYQRQVLTELKAWQKQMLRRPSFLNMLSKKAQDKVNSWIPEKVHKAVTTTIKQMIRGVLFGAKYTTADPVRNLELEVREARIDERIKFYRTTAAVEGGITGAGGILLGLADFPLLIGIKIKLLSTLRLYTVLTWTTIRKGFISCTSSNWRFPVISIERRSILRWWTGIRNVTRFRQILINLTGGVFNRNIATTLISPRWPN